MWEETLNEYIIFFLNFGCRQPFWMTENHFRSHFSPFQINTQLLFFFTKWLPAAILDDRKSLLIALLAISDQYTTSIYFFTKWLPAVILNDRKSLSIEFLAISDQYKTFFLIKWLPAAILDDRKSLLIALLAISFQINTQFFIFLYFLFKMAAGSRFGWPKITFDRNTRHFRSICNFILFYFIFQNGYRWPFWKSDLRQKQ